MANRPNPWGPNWHNENHSSAEMDEVLGQIFGPKCAFMGFMPAGKRKWVKTRPDSTMEVIKIHSNTGGHSYPSFGLSFPWIPHGISGSLRWHRTPKSSVLDLPYEHPHDWSITRRRTITTQRANEISAIICETCEPWFARMMNVHSILAEFERRRANPQFQNYPQLRTAYAFWMARSGKWFGFDDAAKRYLGSYFGEEGVVEVTRLLEKEMASTPS
jgi:hypothetical protein